MSFFSIIHKDKKTRARAGIIHTQHGDLETPMIMTVGTKGTVKGITTRQLEEIGVSVILANTYHLYLSPGNDLIREAGGLHKFMNWNKPMFTDSGGFQIFSMGHGTIAEEIKGVGRNGSKTLLKLTEEGATFRSYIDGSTHLLTPEKSIQIQYDLGADMIAVLDECTPMHVSKRYTERSMEMTHRWLLRCKNEHKRLGSKQALYGIIQGGVYDDLRKHSTEFIAKQNMDGICIGGCLGKDKEEMARTVRMTTDLLPKEKPVHLLGLVEI
jgi:queuine tRNA-ribosyltransferase